MNGQNPEMLAFVYRLQKIIRDMNYTDLTDEEEQARRSAIVESLRDVCGRIERDFGGTDPA